MLTLVGVAQPELGGLGHLRRGTQRRSPCPPESLEGPGPESGLLMAAIGAEGAADTGLGGVGQCADGHECRVRGKGGLWQVPWPWGPEPWEGMEQELSLTLGPSSPPLLPDVLQLRRGRRWCCRRGTQVVLLGLVTATLWAGLLTLLLLWRENIPSPMAIPHVPSRTPTPKSWGPTHPLEPVLPSRPHFAPASPSHISCSTLRGPSPTQQPLSHSAAPLPPFGHLPHDIPEASIPSWQVGCGQVGQLKPLALLSSLLISSPLPCPDWDTMQGLRRLEDITARNGMGGGRVRRTRKPGSCPASVTEHCGMWEENWAPVSPQELRGQPAFLLPRVGGKPGDSWRAGAGSEKRLMTC